MVTLNVTVTDGDRPVTGLSNLDFELYEDGVPQQVRLFDAAQVPLDLILLVDTSSSMRDDMPLVHKAARQFINVLRPQGRRAVVTFTERVTVLQELTSDRHAIEARFFFPSSAHELEGVYAAIAQELRAQYSLAYAPPRSAPDGRFRRILVRLPRHPEFRARSRTGYSADPVRWRR